MRNTDPDHPLLVDVSVHSGGQSKVRPEQCRVTPKRIYTIGGAIYDRATGRRIGRLADLARSMYHHQADPSTLRPNPGYKPEPK